MIFIDSMLNGALACNLFESCPFLPQPWTLILFSLWFDPDIAVLSFDVIKFAIRYYIKITLQIELGSTYQILLFVGSQFLRRGSFYSG